MTLTTDPVIELTKKLIEIPSESRRFDELQRIIAFAREYIDVPGVFIQQFESNGFPSLVATFEETRHPECLMVGHLDVVSARKEDYQASIIGDRLYGRGSGDMKAADAVMIETFKSFALSPEKPSLGLMLTTDEEVGGANGVHYLLEKERYLSDVAFIPDSVSGLDAIVLNQKGVSHVKVWEEGHSAHGSRPYLGENAIEKLMEVYQDIVKAIPVARSSEEWGTTLNLGKIKGGMNVNQVPDYAQLYLDIRYTEPKEMEKVLLEIKRASKGQYDVLADGYPVLIDQGNTWIQQFASSMRSYLEGDVRYAKEEGGSDARFFSRRDVPVIIGGLNNGNTHGEREWVDIKDVLVLREILGHFIENSIGALSAKQK